MISKFHSNCGALDSIKNDGVKHFYSNLTSYSFTNLSEVLCCHSFHHKASNQKASNRISPTESIILYSTFISYSCDISRVIPYFYSLGSHHSSLGSHHSSLGSHYSCLGGHHSNLGGHHSNLGGHHSNLGGHHSNLGSHHSNLGGHHSNLGSHHSNLGSDHSNLGGHHSSRCSDSSNFKIDWFAFSKDIFIYINKTIILSKQMLRCYALHFNFTAAYP